MAITRSRRKIVHYQFARLRDSGALLGSAPAVGPQVNDVFPVAVVILAAAITGAKSKFAYPSMKACDRGPRTFRP